MSLPFPHEYNSVKLSLMLTFFFPVSSLKIAYSAQLLSCFQGNENGAWHCGSFMQIIVRLAVLQDRESTANRHLSRTAWQWPGSKLPYIAAFHSQPPVTLVQAKWNHEMGFIIPFYWEEKLRYKTIKCLYIGHLVPPVLDLSLQSWLPTSTLLLLLNLQT